MSQQSILYKSQNLYELLVPRSFAFGVAHKSSKAYRTKGKPFSTALLINVVPIHSDPEREPKSPARQSLLGEE